MKNNQYTKIGCVVMKYVYNIGKNDLHILSMFSSSSSSSSSSS